MSELKAISSGEIYNIIEYEGSCITDDLYYPKSEADKVIAEQEKEARHHKYKRCMAMAKWCKDRIENVVQYNEHDDWLIINEYWERWHKRWLNIAKQFKDGVISRLSLSTEKQ